MKTTVELIHFICTNPNLKVIVIDDDDKTPMQAIEFLSAHLLTTNDRNRIWRLNDSLDENTLIINYLF